MRVKQCKYFICLVFRLFRIVIGESNQAPANSSLIGVVLVVILWRKWLALIGGHFATTTVTAVNA